MAKGLPATVDGRQAISIGTNRTLTGTGRRQRPLDPVTVSHLDDLGNAAVFAVFRQFWDLTFYYNRSNITKNLFVPKTLPAQQGTKIIIENTTVVVKELLPWKKLFLNPLLFRSPAR